MSTGHVDINTKEKAPSDTGFIKFLISLPRYTKRSILITIDFLLLLFALWSAYSLRLGELYVPANLKLAALLTAAPVISIFCFHYYGLYKLVTRFAGARGALKICVSMAVSILIWCLLIYMSHFTLSSVPRSVIVMFGLLSILFIWGARSAMAYVLSDYLPGALKKSPNKAIPVMIYGVGEEGTQLYHDLDRTQNYELVGFIDDNKSLWRQMIFGLRVHSPQSIVELVKSSGVKEIFLVDPNITRRQKRELLTVLAPYSVKVKTLPALHDIASGKVLISDLQSIGLEDLLGRVPVPPQRELLDKTVRGKSVMITGVGGSIGSELARQVIGLGPVRLVLFERSELALYQIEYELGNMLKELRLRDGDQTTGEERSDAPFVDCEIIGVLGSVLDEDLLERVMRKYEVNTIYHAAAYKHVPIVEDNQIVGVENNVIGTCNAADIANKVGVELFVLISTDKAVRPTNVMGASKRIAELYLQALANEKTTNTVFTMVRFGNVLGSSGSVVDRFREQIKNGGPVTVTHPEIIRYFMTIPEASQLVIQAGGLAEGGDVFVLDMGQPSKIVDLAKSMINLSGLEVADENNPEGDIAIEFIGLRDGEKLFEELLINENCTPTEHVSIIRNHEDFLPLSELSIKLAELRAAIDKFDTNQLKALLVELVEGYCQQEQDCSQNSADHKEGVAKSEASKNPNTVEHGASA